MNAIFGWARMLATGQLGADERSHAAEVILRNATAQVQLIDDLFDVSRIITGNMHLDVRPVDLRAVVEAALDAVRPAVAAKAIRLETALDPRAGPIMGAPDRLQQVIELLSNDLKSRRRAPHPRHLRRRPSGRLIVAPREKESIPTCFLHLRPLRQVNGNNRARGLGIGCTRALLVDLRGGTSGGQPGVGWCHVTARCP